MAASFLFPRTLWLGELRLSMMIFIAALNMSGQSIAPLIQPERLTDTTSQLLLGDREDALEYS